MTGRTRSKGIVIVVAVFVAAVVVFLVGVAVIVVRQASTSESTRFGPDAPLAAFYGDSYTLGTGASASERRWSSVICADRGWNEFNPSVNGLGFVNNRASTPPDYLESDAVSLIIDRRPDILVITMGLNDNFSMPHRADAIRHAIETDFDSFSTALPDTRIIVVEPFWYSDDRPASVEKIISWVEAEAEAIDADYIPDASHWIEGHPEWLAADGLHPNDAGYAAIAKRMDSALDQLGL
jgi:lysophospholipase L1-like esterase